MVYWLCYNKKNQLLTETEGLFMKKRSGIFSLLLSMILIFCFAVPISADLMSLDDVEPAGFEDTSNPYGYKEGDPFPLLVRDELVFFGGCDGSHHTGLKNADSTDALNSFTKVLLANHIKTCVAQDIRDGKTETIDELVSTLQKLRK